MGPKRSFPVPNRFRYNKASPITCTAMRKPEGDGADVLYAFGPFVIDPVKRVVRREHTVVLLQPKAFDVLIALIDRRDRIVEKDELLKENHSVLSSNDPL